MKHVKKFMVLSWVAALALLAGCEAPLSEADGTGDDLTLSDVTLEVGKDGLTLQAALNKVKTARPVEDARYTIVIPAGEMNLGPTTLTAAEGVEKTVTLKKAAAPTENQENRALFNQTGAADAPVIKLVGKGSLFTVPEGVTLELADNIKLVGTDDNNAPLLTVAGSLVLKDNAIITGNRNTADGNKNGVKLEGSLTISGSAVVDGEGGVYIAGGGEIMVAGVLTPENGKAASIVVEEAEAGKAIVRGGGADFFEAKDTSGGTFVVVDAPVVFESLAGMRAFLGSAPLNSVNTPYPVALSGVDVSGFAGGGTGLSAYDRLYRLFAAFQGRYVALDLSACTGTEITCGGGTQLNIDARPDKDKLVSLILPDSLTAIGNYAFARSSSLKSVTMNDGLEIIKADSFIECTSLSSVVLPPSVIELGLTVFNGCTALTSVTLPSSLIINMEGGSSHAFDGCTNLANFVITPVTGGQQGGKRDFREDSVWEIVNGMFSTLEDGKILMLEAAGKKEILFYPAASGHVVIPEGINKIGNSVFSGKYNPWWWEAGDIRFADNPAITGIDLPSSLEVIGWYAFRNCINLDAVTIPDGVTEIKWGAFKGCSKLTKINIPATVKNIWSDAFVGCTNLTGAVTLLEGVEEIGQSVFANTKISSLTLPSTLGKLHDPSPWGNSVTTVTFLSAVPPVITNASIEVGRLLLYDPMFFPYTNEGFQIRVPADSLELYKSTYGWNDYRWINKIVAIEQ